MAKLLKYTLSHDEKKDRWKLVNDQTDKSIKTFVTKDDATRRDTLRKAVGPDGGSVKIQKLDGKFQEERTYPSNADPKSSKG